MANYNDGYIYNANGSDGGFFWNGADYILLLRLHETLKTIDNLSLKLANLILSEKFDMIYQELVMSAIIGTSEQFAFEEESKYMTVFFLADKFGVKDDFSDLLVLAYVNDQQDIIDAVKQFAELISVEEEILSENPNSRALVRDKISDSAAVIAFNKLSDQFGIKDVIDFVRLILTMHDNIPMTDGVPNPKLAVTDWLIGVRDQLDTAYDWVIPFNMKVNWDETSIKTMPPAEIITAELAGIDGSLWEDCTYTDRLFTITAYSEQGLTIQEKEDLKTRITEILDSTKHQSKKLTIQDRGVSFDVKYTNQAEITEAPSWVKCTFDLLAPPYGTRYFEDEILGSGLVDNGKGDAPLGPIHRIMGPCTNPSFSLGEKNYIWHGTIPLGYELYIDHDLMTCYLKNPNGKKENVLSKLDGEFQRIPTGHSVVMQVPSQFSEKITTTWKVKVLW